MEKENNFIPRRGTIRTTLALLVMLLWHINVNSQEASSYRSTVCNSDGTVTFNYRNDKAKEVQVDVQFAGRKAMTRDASTGLWTVT